VRRIEAPALTSNHHSDRYLTQLASRVNGHWPFVLLGTLQAAAAYLAVSLGPVWVLAPLLVLLAIVAFFWPRAGLLLMVAAWFLPLSIFGVRGMFPADAIMLLLAAGYFLQRLSRGLPIWETSSLNVLILLWLSAYALSITNSADLALALKSWLRHAQLFVLFFAAVGVLDRVTIRRALWLFLSLCSLNAIYCIADFVAADGHTRSFGLPGILFSGFLAVAAPYVICQYLIDERRRYACLWAGLFLLFVVAQLANRSRGAMIQLFTGFIFALVVTHRHCRDTGRLQQFRGRLRSLTWAGVLVLVALIATAGTSLMSVWDRYLAHSGSDFHTLQTRAFLWTTSLDLLAEKPLLGLGPGQSVERLGYLDDLRLNKYTFETARMSLHNAFLTYLSEGGLVGTVILLCLLWRGVSLGCGVPSRAVGSDDDRIRLGVWSVVFVLLTRYLYEGHLFYSISGMTTMTFLAMLNNLRAQASGSAAEPSQ